MSGPTSRRSSPRLFVAWLVCVLLGAQAIGWQHRIAHLHGVAATALSSVSKAGACGSATPGESIAAGTTAERPGLPHSCAAFEAATLGASSPSVIAFDFQVFGAVAPAPSHPRADPRSVLALAYLSRAPPATYPL